VTNLLAEDQWLELNYLKQAEAASQLGQFAVSSAPRVGIKGHRRMRDAAHNQHSDTARSSYRDRTGPSRFQPGRRKVLR
jgi:hypothetical protein